MVIIVSESYQNAVVRCCYMLKEGERLEPLGKGIRVIVSDEHKFWTDTILLADFAKPKRKETACELGSGCGAIPLIWCRSD